MNKFVKLTAASIFAMSAAAPAFAASHAVDISTVTCGEYNAMGEADRDKLAVLAVQEISGMTGGSIVAEDGAIRGDETAATSPGQESAAQNESAVTSSDGAPAGTSTITAGNDETMMAEKVSLLNLTCERFSDVTLIDAASGNDGKR